jgi:hypothetical protein
MASWYDWWKPLGQGPFETQATYLNLLLPFLNPHEQGLGARQLRAIDSPDIDKAIGGGYQLPQAGAQGEATWLRGLSGLSTALDDPTGWVQPRQGMAPGFAQQWGEEFASLAGDPNLEWFQSLADVAGSLSPDMTRRQQRDARRAIDDWLAQAPDELQGIGSYLLHPYLDRPGYGSAAAFGSYQQPYQVKGGLVANPWYV